MLAALIKKELLSLLRDVYGVAALFMMPALFIIVMSMALKDFYEPAARPLIYGVENLDQGKPAARLLDRWAQENGPPQPLSADWHTELAAGRLQYVLVVDAGFSAQASDLDSKGDAKVRLLAEPGLNQALFETKRAKLIEAVTRLRAEILLAQLDLGINAAALAESIPVVAERAGAGPRPTAVQQNVPAWLLFGMFFVVASISSLFVEERACGALARLRSLGARPWRLVVGKLLPYLLVNGLQAALMLAIGIWLMPVIGGEGLSLQGVNWGALIVMLLAISLAAVSLALALACLVGSHSQAMTIGPTIIMLMAALGGIMVPTFLMPPVMQTLASYVPMNWGFEGLLNVLLRNGDFAAIAPAVTKLTLFALLMLGSGFVLFRRRL
ncbi:MAG: ABC transporter permease [Zoogloeaceae bacterium]|jgi:ABC-2 type transport system permease protein|nr:ABC transporter permease [Zoogloeaceae bacterium]